MSEDGTERGSGKVCPNCGGALKFLMRENLQLGKTGFLLGDWPNLLAGALDVDFWSCPACGKLELYLAEPEEALGGDGITQITCRSCGVQYDLDTPSCPHCGAKNPRW